MNGVLSSITGFLGFLSLVEAGVGSVVRAELYQPVASKDTKQICVIIQAARDYFRKISIIYLFFAAAFAVLFSLTVQTGENNWYSFFLVLITATTNLAQYSLGAGYMQLLYADQKLYLLYCIQAVSYLLQIILTIWLTAVGAGIHVVQLASAFLFLIRPIVVSLYGRKTYSIPSHTAVTKPVLRQKWNNLFQTIAYFVHIKTDVMVLTVFCSFADISVYSVYAMVTTGLSSIIRSMSHGFASRIGNLYGRKDSKLQDTFSAYELFICSLTVICFVTAACVIQDFVSIYTRNLTDAEYRQPVFGLVLIFAEAIYCIRLPYNNLVSVAGHFRQTQAAAVIEAGMNIVISVLFVRWYGLTGAAAGTLAAMAYRTVYLAFYASQHILRRSIRKFLKIVLVFSLTAISSAVVCRRVTAFIRMDGIWSWTIKSFLTMAITAVVVGIADLTVFCKESSQLFHAFFDKEVLS